MTAGWRWAIPLTTRIGNGYVYSSRYLDRDQAERELRIALGLTDADGPARHLEMKVGRLERSWTANCLAMGLAQGFIEPLEATALYLAKCLMLSMPGLRDEIAVEYKAANHGADRIAFSTWINNSKLKSLGICLQ